MPGKRITDLQVSKYKELRGKHGQEAAAAKTGISVASARRPDLADDGAGAIKKDVLVVKAASRLAGKRWLPAPLRRPPG